MRKLLPIVLVAVLPLFGCAKQADEAAQLVALAKSQCHFVIDYVVAEKLLAASADAAGGGGIVTGVVNIANAVCTAVTAPAPQVAAAVHQCPMVNGVCITGKFEDKP